MQQRDSNTTMDTGEPDNTILPPSRGRLNSKLKVLVRSHAFREETSPPRELLSPNVYHQLAQQPRIKLIPSPDGGCGGGGGTSPVVVLSPTPSSRGLSPDAATVVPATGSIRCSPTSIGEEEDARTDFQENFSENPSPKYMNKLNNARNLDLPKQSSHNSIRKKFSCDCPNQMCVKCAKIAETNLNNNLTSVNNNNNNNMTTTNNPNMLSVIRARGKLKQQSSSQGSFESSSNSPCLSRDSSSEQYTDTTGVDLEQFIPETLNRNAKDRALMLRIEQELVSLAKDRYKTHYKFPQMSSYQRMLVHRCAAYFGMEHNVEPTGKSVVVNKTKCTRIPEVEFKNYIREDAVFTEEPRRSILKRDSNSIEDYSFKSPDRSFSLENRRSKSFEEREEEYEKARRRIFNREVHDGSSEDFGWSEIPWSSTESEYSTRFRLLPPDCHRRQLGKLIKVHSEDTAETLRPFVAKSYSFGGYGGNISVLSRGDSVVSTHSAGPRLLTKQDSGASSVSWRLSPSSSGYKSQSQMSESVTPSPTSTPHPVCDSSGRQDSGIDDENAPHDGDMDPDDSQIVWAVTDMQRVPKGSIIINPQTGRPIQNEDGSVYHYDPNNIIPELQLPLNKPPSPQHHSPKDNTSLSPKKPRCQKLSPTRKSHFTNSSTSPSLPFSPSPPQQTVQIPSSSHHQQNCYSYAHSDSSSISSMHHSQHQFGNFTSYGTTPTAPAESTATYQHPYIVYTTSPYGVHMAQQYDGRIDGTSVPDMGSTYYIQDGSGPPPSQPITYQHTQPQTYWNQHLTYYPNGPQAPSATPPQRYSAGTIPTQAQTGYFQQTYIPQAQPVAASLQPPSNPPTEFIPVYPNQQMQLVYQGQPVPPAANPMVYQSQPPVIYATAQGSVYAQPTPTYPPQQMTPQMGAQPMPPYPQGTPTPNSCTSSVSGPIFPVTPTDPQAFVQLAQGMQQMTLGSQTPPHGFIHNKGSFEFRPRQPNRGSNYGNKNKSGNQPLGFVATMGCSSQSSTGTSSPAATVVAAAAVGFSSYPQHQQHYRTPPDTPPAHFAPTFVPNFNMPPPHGPVMYKPMANVRATTPGTTRNSRSPTPAGDAIHYERQRMSLPPNLYQGMPYVLPSDPRLISGKGAPNMYRQVAPLNRSNFIQGSDNRSHRNRKSKPVNKQQGLPPSGK